MVNVDEKFNLKYIYHEFLCKITWFLSTLMIE